jgi:site-specific DNA-methyltransferase (adenine-specific)
MSVPTPYYDDGKGIVIYHGDCREILPHLPKVDLVLTDPPYHGVVEESWDNQWASDHEFLSWVNEIGHLLDNQLVDNGTVYFFASPQMAARVEVALSQHFTVIAHAVWNKGAARQGAAGSGVDITALRTYWASNTERVIVAEKRLNAAYLSADQNAQQQSGYWQACEGAKVSVFGQYLKSEFKLAKVTNTQIADLFPSKTGGRTGCVSNWLLGLNVPTAAQYQSMRLFLNGLNGAEYLKENYEYLKENYEELKENYEELRRPFFMDANDQWGQVWEFAIERDRKHPTQKPLPLISQIVKVSSRPSNTILDPFMGSGTTLVAAQQLGRKAIGIEISQAYCDIAIRRLSQQQLPLTEPLNGSKIEPQEELYGTSTVRGNKEKDFVGKLRKNTD